MKNLFSLILFFGLSVLMFSCKDKVAPTDTKGQVAVADGIKYAVAPEKSTISWEGAKPTSKHTGTINITDGQIYINNGKLTSGDFNIDMNTITVTDLAGDEKNDLEAHLKGSTAEGADHFFDITKFPVGKFEITSVVDAPGENGVNTHVKGNLTLKGITKEIAIPASVAVSDAEVTVTTPSFNINRTDWGVNYRSKSVFSDLGDKFINDEIALKINFTAKNSTAPLQ